jgi:serine-type D-Ala-D-Ala carboxypeptidase (penicillin-binding protein 5/6)
LKKWCLCLLSALLVANPAWARTAQKPAKQAAPVKKAAVAAKRPPAPAPKAAPVPPAPKPEVQAPYQAYIVVEASTGNVLEEANSQLKWPLASVTKLMLASVVMEKLQSGSCKLADTVTASEQASKMGGSQVYLRAGETFPLEEMMKAIMVASGNDAAYAVAEHISGTAESFVEEMNKKAKSLGMNDSEFHSPHGLPPSPGQSEDQSSCRDLVTLGRDLLKYPKLLEWTSLRSEPFRDGSFMMHNHNKIIGKLPGADGFKTGFFAKAGFNVVVTAQKDGLRMIAVVLGSPSARIRDNLAIEKLKKYMAKYSMVSFAKKDEGVGNKVAVPDGEVTVVQAVAAADFAYPVSREKVSAVKKEIHLSEKVDGGIEAGQKLGELVVTLDKQPLGKVDLVSPTAIKEAGFFKKLMRRFGMK